MTTAQTVRETIAALAPPARAFERAKSKGLIVLDEQLGFVEVVFGLPPEPKCANPAQLRLEGVR
jgi:hypothetical protein